MCYHYLDLSKPLVRTGITCLVPFPKQITNWITFLTPFSSQVWLYMALFHFFTILTSTLMLICYKKYFSHTFLTLAIEIVLKPVVIQPLTKQTLSVQTFINQIIWIVQIFSLILVATYSSGLASVMTIPQFVDPVDSVKDFVKSNLDWGATENAWITSIEQAEDPVNTHLVKKFHSYSKQHLSQLSKTGHFAFSIERLPSSGYSRVFKAKNFNFIF